MNPERFFIQGSVEAILIKRIGIELGYGRRFMDPKGGPVLHFFGETIMLDLNYYSKPLFNKHNVRLRIFGGLGFKKIRDNKNSSITFSNKTDHKDFTEEIGVHKKLLILSTKFGLEILFCKMFGFDISVEPGLKYKEQSLDSHFWNQDGYTENKDDIYLLGKVPYKGYQPNLNISVRLFHYFNFKAKEKDSKPEKDIF